MPASVPSLADVVQELVAETDHTVPEVAEDLGVTYQTIKNLIDGRSVSARVIMSIIRKFHLENDKPRLRRLLLGFLRCQLPEDDGTELMKKADLF